ncbi:LOW QUALITY PROTEIN: hypothetical protein HID58_041516 [Brassica napus]|uniref:Uncharacterized protein n=2 Tax=Brassica TaxID=3705 RepID=A0ABQ8BBF2_BRANA|nr:LOW QUALITY PROTEIN: hypothetical protein HID58_041516 [Brassica napus]
MSLKLLQRERVLARRKVAKIWIDSRLEAYEFDRNRPLMDQKTIDDRVKALLEERLKVLGVGKIPENNDNPSPPSADKSLSLASLRVQTQQNSVNSPVLAATPGKVFGPKKNLAKELDKESGVKRTLAEEFGSVAKATDLDSQHLDFLVVTPAKATKDDKVPAYGRACRGKHTVNDEDAADKKKQSRQMLRRRRLRLRKKEARAKKKEAQASKKEENEFAPESDVERSEVVRSAVIKEYREKRHCSFFTSSFSVHRREWNDMLENVTPASVIYDPLAPVDPILLKKLMQHIKRIPPKPPAPADKPAVLSADHEVQDKT